MHIIMIDWFSRYRIGKTPLAGRRDYLYRAIDKYYVAPTGSSAPLSPRGLIS